MRGEKEVDGEGRDLRRVEMWRKREGRRGRGREEEGGVETRGKSTLD